MKPRINACRFFAVRLGFMAVVTVLPASGAFASSLGTVEATFPFRSYELIADPHQPFVYASDPSDNAIQVINTQTLAIAHKISLGATPNGIALSADGQSLYVTQPSNQIAVISTQSFAISRTIPTPSTPIEIAAGLGNRLFVLDVAPETYTRIQQIDATTGASLGPDFYGEYYGNFQISHDLKTLYFGEHALSPTTLQSFDVSSTNVQTIAQTQTGFNGYDVILSHSGNWIAQPNGAPNVINLLNAKDLSVLGSFQFNLSGPVAMAFSPDDRFAYVATAPNGGIEVFSTSTFQKVGGFSELNAPVSLVTDPSGEYLFASRPGDLSGQPSTVVYDTGYSVPEPSSIWLIGFCLPLMLTRRRMLTHDPAIHPKSP